MSQPLQVLFMLVLLLPLWLLLRRSFISGLSYAIVLLVACTHSLKISAPGMLPDLNIHRLVIVSLLVFWLRERDRTQRLMDVPLARQIRIWAVLAMISLLGTSDYGTSIKRYLEYVLEFFLLYFILATSLKTREDAFRVLRSVCIGLIIVSALAFVHKYSGVNLVARVFPQTAMEDGASRMIVSTYRHRILLGTGMAMGWPLLLYFSLHDPVTRRRRLAWCAQAALLAACYFARSRGPWISAGLAGGFLFIFGTGLLRKRLVLVGVFGVLLLVARPGVFETISRLAEDTKDVNSLKGGTFRYRLELWNIAYSQISNSPWRLLFGCGPGVAAGQSLDWTLSYRAKDVSVTSWDNDLAYALYQYGFLGLFATFVLYGTIFWRLLSCGRRVQGADRDLFVSLAASVLVLIFMMSNVMIFAQQLYYLLWTFAATGFALKAYQSEPAEEPALATNGLSPQFREAICR